jgi:PAS domain-containing protein
MRNRLEDDVIDGILLNSREITERKEREHELRALAGEYEALLNNAEDAIFFIDVDASDTDITFEFDRLSPAYERQTGLTTEEVRGETPRDVFGDQAGAELEANYHRCVKAREPISYRLWHRPPAYPIYSRDSLARPSTRNRRHSARFGSPENPIRIASRVRSTPDSGRG